MTAFSQPAKTADGAKPAAGAQKQKVVVGGTRRQTLDGVQAAFKAAGLIPDQIVLGVIGPVNAFELPEFTIIAAPAVSAAFRAILA